MEQISDKIQTEINDKFDNFKKHKNSKEWDLMKEDLKDLTEFYNFQNQKQGLNFQDKHGVFKQVQTQVFNQLKGAEKFLANFLIKINNNEKYVEIEKPMERRPSVVGNVTEN